MRKVRVNGAPIASAEGLLEYLRILWLTPAMDGLFTGPAAERRRFLDRLVLAIDPGHGRRVRDFERLLSQRNRLLEENGAPAWLDAVEAQLAEKAVAVALARSETAALLAARIAAGSAGSAFPAGRIALSGGFDQAIAGRTRRRGGALVPRRAGRRPRERPRCRAHARRAAPQRPRHSLRREGHAGRRLLHRRAEGAADRAHPGACRADRRA